MTSIGVLTVFQNEKIPLDYIVGTSAGAMVGACYAFGYPLEKAYEMGVEVSKRSRFEAALKSLRYCSLRFSGILTSKYFYDMFNPFMEGLKFEDALIPFAAMASDLRSGKTRVIKSGNLLSGIIASNSAPVLFEPYRYHRELLIDGASTDPLPIQVLINEKIDIKIAVSIPQLDYAISTKKKLNVIDVFFLSRFMMAEKIMTFSSELADVVIRPRVEGLSKEDWHYFEQIISAGESAGQLAVKQIKSLLEK